MLDFKSLNTVAVGEAMVELAPVGNGLYRAALPATPSTPPGIWRRPCRGAPGWGLSREWALTGFPMPLSPNWRRTGWTGLSSGVTRCARWACIWSNSTASNAAFHYWRDTSAARGLASDAALLAAAFDGAGLIHLSGITLAILPQADREKLFAALALARAGGARRVLRSEHSPPALVVDGRGAPDHSAYPGIDRHRAAQL